MKKSLLSLIVFIAFVGNSFTGFCQIELTIYQIQSEMQNGDTSAYFGDTVTTHGIVTGLQTYGAIGYYIQDSASAWNGIFVYDNTNGPAVGDSITITAEVTEYYGLTELTNVSNLTVEASGLNLPEPVLLSTADANSEEYEGVLIKVENAECTSDTNTFGEWYINDGSGELQIDDNMYDQFSFTPTVGTEYDITGIISYSYSEYELLPRDLSDIEIYFGIMSLDIKQLKIYPNPVRDILYIENLPKSHKISVINYMGQKIFERNNLNVNSYIIDVSRFSEGVYFVRIIAKNGAIFTRKFVLKKL